MFILTKNDDGKNSIIDLRESWENLTEARGDIPKMKIHKNGICDLVYRVIILWKI